MAVFSFACVYCDGFVVVKAVSETLAPSQGSSACACIFHVESREHADAVAGCAVERAGAFGSDSMQVSEHTVAVGFGVVADGLDVEHVAVQEFRPCKFGIASDVIRIQARLELLGGLLDGLDGERGGVCCECVW